MTAMHKTLGFGLSVLLALSMAACGGGPRGRLMSDSEEDQVGNRAAGAETWDRLVAGTVEKLLSSRAAAISGLGQKKIAVMPVENKSAEELGDWRDQLYEVIATSVNASERFRTISPEFLRVALTEARVSGDEVYLPRGRRAIAQALEQKGAPIEMLLRTTITTGTTNPGQRESQRNYGLTLVLIDIETGEEVNRSMVRVRKEYSR